MSHCLFCQIASHNINANVIYEDDEIIAFHDISPQAPIHVLVIPKAHIESINHIEPQHQQMIGKMVTTAARIASELGIDESGYRLVMNCNRDGGQTVFHIHIHLIGGRAMHWPPG